MPRKRSSRTPPVEKRSDPEDDDFFFDDTQSNSGRSSHEPQHRNAANARERARMRVLSKAFCRLKTTLPWVPADTKLSKLDTLRLAASYIAHLRALLHDEPRSASQMFPHPLNLAWPFAIQHGGSVNRPISPRWSPNSETTSSNQVTSTSRNTATVRENTQNCMNNVDNYNHDYSLNSYRESEYDEIGNQTTQCNDGIHYNNCLYKDNNYYAMRNCYPSDSLMNNA